MLSVNQIVGFLNHALLFYHLTNILTKDRINKIKDINKTGLNRTQKLIETCNARNKFCSYS